MTGAERQRRRRERIRAGLRLVTIEVDELNLCETLVRTGDLDPMRDDDPEEIRGGLLSLLTRLHRAVTRDATR